MSCSPLRTTPWRVTWREPRAASSEPVPVESAKDWTALRSGAWTAVEAIASPLPEAAGAPPATGAAVEVSSALIWSGVACGCSWTSRAARPDTTAAASEVPLPRKKRVPTAPVEAY
jgi:hypothetical protein